MPKPLKRYTALQPLSREHHQGLLLCFKLREGFKKDVAPQRMQTYCRWFYDTYLQQHFKVEEEHVFSVLGAENELVKKAVAQHEQLHQLFTKDTAHLANLELIETELQNHIRFEERELFELIQQEATEAELQKISERLDEQPFRENTDDQFWL